MWGREGAAEGTRIIAEVEGDIAQAPSCVPLGDGGRVMTGHPRPAACLCVCVIFCKVGNLPPKSIQVASITVLHLSLGIQNRAIAGNVGLR